MRGRMRPEMRPRGIQTEPPGPRPLGHVSSPVPSFAHSSPGLQGRPDLPQFHTARAWEGRGSVSHERHRTIPRTGTRRPRHVAGSPPSCPILPPDGPHRPWALDGACHHGCPDVSGGNAAVQGSRRPRSLGPWGRAPRTPVSAPSPPWIRSVLMRTGHPPRGQHIQPTRGRRGGPPGRSEGRGPVTPAHHSSGGRGFTRPATRPQHA